MAKFLKGDDLNSEIGKIFENAEERLFIISPYIKLHHRIIERLKSKISNPKLEIYIVFGKNENDLTKSLTSDDFELLKQFPNIEIRYEKRLHAKFYANESSQILTSMNLYNYSHDNNIEAGVKTEFNFLGNIASKMILSENTFDQEAWDYFCGVVNNSDLLFKNEPEYESALFGITKKYKGIKNVKDTLSVQFANTNKEVFQKEGYCIRTGEKIPFNLQKPYSEKAYKSWAQYKNPNYKEKYCHKTGKPSEGKTSMTNPIL